MTGQYGKGVRQPTSTLSTDVTHAPSAELKPLPNQAVKSRNEARGALERAYAEVANSPLRLEPITATTDARFFGLYAGTPALVFGPRAEAIHGFNERIDLDSLRRVTQTTALFIADWCGLETR